MFWIGKISKKKSKKNMAFEIVIIHKAHIDMLEGIK